MLRNRMLSVFCRGLRHGVHLITRPVWVCGLMLATMGWGLLNQPLIAVADDAATAAPAAASPAEAAAAAPAPASAPAPRLPRTPWTTSRVVGSPEPPLPYQTVHQFTKLPVEQPIYAQPEPGTNNYIRVEHLGNWAGPGRLSRFRNDPEVDSAETLLDVDRLIYGFCFDPKYRENGWIYLVSNGPIKAEKKFQRISRYTIERTAPFALLKDSELVILEWESDGHNGGEAAFGPDGYLYCATGDGTSDSDPLLTGQGVNDLLAVMLRLDVSQSTPERPYTVPEDNPFRHLPDARPEIWAFGFRNPWRITFDPNQGHLWVTQNGQDLWEQVYLVRKGENYGWSVQEGGHPFYPERPVGPGPIVPPVVDHHHSEARSLTGGVVYTGSQLPELRGAYIYGDFSTGRIWGLKHNGQQLTWHQELVDTPFGIVGFVNGIDGELLVIDQQTGFHRLVPATPVEQSVPFPTKLSDTGLFTSVVRHEVAPGVISYDVNSPLWSDGAHKERFFALPGNDRIAFEPEKAWRFNNGTVLVKTFSLDRTAGDPTSRQRIETRIMTRQQKEWVGYTYEWNDEQTEAYLVEKSGKDKAFVIADAAAEGGQRVQTWHYPSRTECLVCHSRAAGFVLGLQTAQLNREAGPVPEGSPDEFRHQLKRWAAMGYLQTKSESDTSDNPGQPLDQLPKAVAEYPRLAHPYDPSQPLEDRVRSYLHVNCSVCHQLAGGGNAQIELQYQTKLADMKLLDVAPLHDKFGIADARLVAPAAPERSVLLQRISRRGKGQMPPLASSIVDEQGVALLSAWVKGLPVTPAATPPAATPPASETPPASSQESKEDAPPASESDADAAAASQ
jgi:uncharacterized repeat protein (TIGR03806 family)